MPEGDWGAGFASHARAQERRALELTPEERLRWLDETKAFCARYLGAARRAGGKRPPTEPS